MQTEKPDAVELVELLLTAEIYNRVPKLTEADLPPDIRRHYFDSQLDGVRRPIAVTRTDAEKMCGYPDFEQMLPDLAFLKIDKRHDRLAEFDAAAAWFSSQDTADAIRENPVLAHYYSEIRSRCQLSRSKGHQSVNPCPFREAAGQSGKTLRGGIRRYPEAGHDKGP